jgi:hypothetical protein
MRRLMFPVVNPPFREAIESMVHFQGHLEERVKEILMQNSEEMVIEANGGLTQTHGDELGA